MGIINIHGRRMSEEVAKQALKEQGISPTKAHLARLADIAPDRDSNTYLNKSELAKGAKALLKELHGGAPSPGLTPNRPIENVLKLPPASLARYDIHVSDDRAMLTFDPRQPKSLLATRAAGAKSVNVGHNFLGGIEVNITNAAGETSPFKDAKWVKKSFADVVQKKADLDRLEKNGYDVNAKRDMLVANTEGDSSPTIFALRDLKIDDNAPPPKGGPNVRLAKTDDTRGFVAICSEVTIEWFGDRPQFSVKKPVIYVYPEKKTHVKVKVDVVGQFTAQYPQVENGTWEMIATPDGTLFDPKTEKKYSYIFWEGTNPGNLAIDPARAYCVKSSEVERFLDDACRKIGLSDRERTDFVSYWIAPLVKNPVSLIQFLTGDACAAYAKMTVEPKPESEIRLFMIFQRVPEVVKTGNPELPEARRGKYTVVEWGGANLDEIA